MNFEQFVKVMEEQQIEPNAFFNTFDIMRNYLDNEAMHDVLAYLFGKGFTNFTYYILTANNITDFTFITRFQAPDIVNISRLILSRNKITKDLDLWNEILKHVPNLVELDLSQNLFEKIETQEIDHGLAILNLSRNQIKMQSFPQMKGLKQLYLFGNQIEGPHY
jgi:Leucine-rich repeat (LRR) protein